MAEDGRSYKKKGGNVGEKIEGKQKMWKVWQDKPMPWAVAEAEWQYMTFNPFIPREQTSDTRRNCGYREEIKKETIKTEKNRRKEEQKNS
jgi:hypothetical protein